MILTALEWELWKYIPLFLLSAVKFLGGLLAAIGTRMTFWETVAVVGGGAWAGSWIYAYFGTALSNWIRVRFRRRKPMSFKSRRRIVKIWNRYGLWGVAFFSVVLSPMISIGVAVSLQEHPRKIMLYMTVAILFWSVLFGLGSDWIRELIQYQ